MAVGFNQLSNFSSLTRFCWNFEVFVVFHFTLCVFLVLHFIRCGNTFQYQNEKSCCKMLFPSNLLFFPHFIDLLLHSVNVVHLPIVLSNNYLNSHDFFLFGNFCLFSVDLLLSFLVNLPLFLTF